MNIQQIEYVVAVAELSQFSLAADKCSITQSTLSTMIAKFEDEIGIKIFDRTTKPVTITREGENIIHQLRSVLRELKVLDEVIGTLKDETSGSVRIGIIPTVAPFLLPRFLPSFVRKFPNMHFTVVEMTTAKIIESLRERTLDIGIVSTPLDQDQINETPLYSEPFVLYDEKLSAEGKVKITSLSPHRFWLLEEGHCMRTQVQRICDLENFGHPSHSNLEYKSGSIDTLLKLVQSNRGSTLLPYLATLDLAQDHKNKIATFESPVPARTIGMVVHRHFLKKKVLLELREEIQKKILPLLDSVESPKIINPL